MSDFQDMVNMRESIINKVSMMSNAEMTYAMADIKEVLVIWRDHKSVNDPYIAKIYFEFDSILDERRKRESRLNALIKRVEKRAAKELKKG